MLKLTQDELLARDRWFKVNEFLEECIILTWSESLRVIPLPREQILIEIKSRYEDQPYFTLKTKYMELYEINDSVPHQFRRAKCIPLEIIEKTVDEDGVTLCEVRTFNTRTKKEETKYLAYHGDLASVGKTRRVYNGVKIKVRNMVVKKLKG